MNMPLLKPFNLLKAKCGVFTRGVTWGDLGGISPGLKLKWTPRLWLRPRCRVWLGQRIRFRLSLGLWGRMWSGTGLGRGLSLRL